MSSEVPYSVGLSLTFIDDWPVLAACVKICELAECCVVADCGTDATMSDDAACDMVFELNPGWSEACEATI